MATKLIIKLPHFPVYSLDLRLGFVSQIKVIVWDHQSRNSQRQKGHFTMSWNITCTAAVLNLLVETTWQQKHFMSARQNAPASILYTCVQKCTYLNACSILGSAIKCPLKSKRKPTVCNLMVTVGVRVIFRLRLRLLFIFVSEV